MSAMSASSGVMPLSLISEHKSGGQGGGGGVQPLSFASPEKHPLQVQPAKPTPNGMEVSPSAVSQSLPPSQPHLQSQSQPELSVLPGGVVSNEGVGITPGNGNETRATPVEGLPVDGLPPSIPVTAEQPTACEPPRSNETGGSGAVVDSSPPPCAAPQQQPGCGASAPLDPPPAETPPSEEPPQPAPAEPTESSPAPVSVEPSLSEAAVSEPVPQPQPQAQPLPDPPKEELKPEVSQPAPGVPRSEEEAQPQGASLPPPALSPSTAPVPPSTRPPKRTKSAGNTNEKKTAATGGAGGEGEAGSSQGDSKTADDGKRTKRKRLPTQVYQSPAPEDTIIAKISKIDKTHALLEDKLIVFYRNEFLAVRNTEGSFYVCQAMQNVYKSSARIRIRWLSQVENTDHYSPDFYDTTEFDCILTNLNMERIEKNKYRLPDIEAQRTQSILKRAIDVENGVVPAEDTNVTEEHPDGLDLSLYRNEEQLKKRKGNPKKSSKRKVKKEPAKGTREVPKRSKPVETKKPAPPAPVNPKKVVASKTKDKTVVQRIVAAKQMGRRKAGGSSKAPQPVAVSKKAPEKKEAARPPPKRKNPEPAPAASEKKQKTANAKTRSGVAGGPSGSQQQNTRARRSSRTK